MDSVDRCRMLGFLLVLLCLTGQASGLYNVATAKTLYDTLVTNYTILLRPSDVVNVSLEFSALTVNYLDVKSQAFSITGWLTINWLDPQLVWTPSSYANITEMFFTDDYIWTPELVIQNSATNIPIIDKDNLNLKVTYTGLAEWNPPGVYVVNCEVDITYYPFDSQSCYVSISTWSHDSSTMRLLHFKSSINLEDYQKNGEWELLSTDTQTADKTDRNDASVSRDQMLFVFNMQRKPGYYILNIILPPILTSFLGLMVFLLPAESGEKVGYSITVLLALAVLLTIISTYIPTTSKNTSLFGVYLTLMMFMNAFKVIITILILNIHHRADKEIPVSAGWQKFANQVLARTSCFRSTLRPRCCGKRNENFSENGHIFKSSTPIIHQKMTVETMEAQEKTIPQNKLGTVARRPSTRIGNYTDTLEKSQECSNDETKEYTWPEIAVMSDITSLYVCFVLMMFFTVVFILILAIN